VFFGQCRSDFLLAILTPVYAVWGIRCTLEMTTGMGFPTEIESHGMGIKLELGNQNGKEQQ